MVVRRIVRYALTGKRKRIPRFPRHGSVIQRATRWLIADSNGSSKSHVKRVKEYTSAWTNITDSAQRMNLCDQIDAGQEVNNRLTNKINLLSARFTGAIQWDSAGTPPNGLRIILALVNKGTSPAVAFNSDIYGRNSFPEIRHVYYDRKFYRYNADILNKGVKFTRRFKGLPIKYNGPTGSTDLISRDIQMIMVSDNGSSTADIVDPICVLRWSEA